MKTSVRSRILPIAAAALITSGLVTSMVEAATIVIDDFESYANNAAFQAVWTHTTTPGVPNVVPRSLDTSVAHTGSQSMRIDYNTGVTPFFGQVRRFAPGPAFLWNFSDLTKLEFWYLGQATNSLDGLGFRLEDTFGSNIVNIPFPVGQTQVTSWTRGVLDFSTFTPIEKAKLNSVGQVRIGLTGLTGAFGTGVMWFDDIRVVPEPTALGLALMGACGCLMRRRRLR